MLKKLLILLTITGGVWIFVLAFNTASESWAQGANSTMTAPQILSDWAEAVGGVDKLRQVQTVHWKGTITSSGLNGTVEDWFSADGRHRGIIDLSEIVKVLQVFDGRNGWILENSNPVRPLSGPELEDEVSADFTSDDLFLSSKDARNVVQYLGMSGDGKQHMVEIDPQGGKKMLWYLDAKTFLPASEVQHEGGTDVITTFDDWRKVGGVMFAFHMHELVNHPRNETDIRIKQLELNQPMEASLFKKPAEVASSARITIPGGKSEIPFELYAEHIFTQAKINGSSPRWFLLDSGDPVIAIDSRMAGDLHITGKGHGEAGGYGSGSLGASFVKNVTLALPGVEVGDLTGIVSPLNRNLGSRLGRRLDGIFGYDFLSRFVVKIDYVSNRLTVYDPATFQYSGSGSIIPIQVENQVPIAAARLTMLGKKIVEGRFLIDCGAGNTVTIYRPFAETHQLMDSEAKGITVAGGGGVGGESHDFVTRLTSLKIGPYDIQSPVAQFSLDKAGEGKNSDYAGGIGFGILGKFNVIFDYPHSRMILEPNSHFDDWDRYDASGLTLLAEGDQLDKFKVEHVLPKTPGSEAKISEGDYLVMIDGKPTKEMTLGQLKKFFRDAGKTYQLTIERNGTTLVRRITLRELI